MRIFTIIFLLLIPFSVYSSGIETDTKDKSVFFLQPAFLLGKTFHANSNFPETRLQTIYSLSFGKFVFNPKKLWAVYYNYPSVGLTFSKSSFGNDQSLGNAYSLIPYLDLNLSKKLRNSFHVRLGLGISYFTNHFDKVGNPDNKAIGSALTWTFRTTFHYTLLLRKYFSLHVGAGFIHHSNGHTQLPNLGLNSFVGSISTTFYLSKLDEQQQGEFYKPKITKTKQFFIEFRSGIGMHELGDYNTSLEKMKKAVFSFSAGGGIIFKRILKLRTGFTYRFYQHYYNYINTFKPPQYTDAPLLNSSNLFFYVGCELLIGHVGFEAEVGVNIYKPFYKEHSQRFEDDSEMSYTLKKVLATRMGIKVYALSTLKNPRNNFFFGAHINANMGQADFSELSLGYVHRFKKIYSKNSSSSF